MSKALGREIFAAKGEGEIAKGRLPHHANLVDAALDCFIDHFDGNVIEVMVRFAAQFPHSCTDANCPGGKRYVRDTQIHRAYAEEVNALRESKPCGVCGSPTEDSRLGKYCPRCISKSKVVQSHSLFANREGEASK